MTLDEITKQGIDPALRELPSNMDTDKARVLLLATGLQESRFQHRQQIVGGQPTGPAKGFWQFEKGGGVKGAMTHAASKNHLQKLCHIRGVPFDAQSIWDAIKNDDVLAAGLARLLYWTDPWKLPEVTDTDGAWELYLRTWRPGKPHKATWKGFHDAARLYVSAG